MKTILHPIAALCAVISISIFTYSPAVSHAAGCGDGILAMNEECDGGPGGLFVDGDPANETCASGSRCYFQFSCCKFNCQYVGTPGAPCQDGNSCSGPDTCNQVGVCLGGPNAANDTPCDDGLFCTGPESCQNGACLPSSGDPCPGTACNICQEDTDSCFNAEGTPCSDGNGCVTGGTCNGAGTCNGGVFNEGPCDDGLFCNGADTCAGGACGQHAGDPCLQSADGDGNCAESCDEASDLCTAPDPEGAACEDGLFCNGAGDVCAAGTCLGSATTTCDDFNSCTTDACDEITDGCSYVVSADGAACSDDDQCTVDDTCAAGVCTGAPPVMFDLCPWTVLLRENEKKDLIKTNFRVNIDGDICGGTMILSGETRIGSDAVSGRALGSGQLRLAQDVVVVDDIVSAGGGAKAYPGSGNLPYVLPASNVVAPLSLLAKSGGSGSYDLTGTHPLAGDCIAARTSYEVNAAALDSFPATVSLPALNIGAGQTATLTAASPGALNVFDIGGSVKAGKDSVLELDGGGNADTVMVLRVSGKFSMLLRSAISLNGGMTPANTLIYVKGKKCLLSDLSIGAGTIFCSPGRLKTGRSVAWVGALFGGGKLLKLGEKNSIQFSPFHGF